MTTRRPHLAATLALAFLLLAGCGSDDSPPKDAAPSTSSGAESSAPAPADPPADVAAAARINLNAADLGAGWTSTPAEVDDGSDEEFEKEFLACVGIASTDAPGDDISSPDFTNADNVELSSGVDFYATAEDAAAEIAALSGPKTAPCLEKSFTELLNKEIASDGSKDAVTSVKAKVTDASALVDGAKSLQLDIAAAVSGQNVTFAVTLVTFTRGRIGVAFSSFVLGPTPAPPALYTKALRAVAARAEAEA